MKQIKTISHPEIEALEEKVEAALKEGWELTNVTLDSRGKIPVFIAELEREGGVPKNCSNCKHTNLDANRKPCRPCLVALKNGKGFKNYEEAKE